MKILYILGDYKPYMSANGVCSDNVIQKLLEEEHTVTALVKTAFEAPIFSKQGNLTVVRVKPRLALRLSQKSEALRNRSPLKSRFYSFLSKIINKPQMLFSIFRWPTVSPMTNRRFKKAAIKLHKENNFDAVISVYTPIESLLAGYELKKLYPDIKFYPYFLDSLSGGFGPRCFSKEKVIKRCLKTEKRVFQKAEKVVVMKSSKPHHEKYNPEFFDKIVFLDVPTFCKNNACINIGQKKPEDSPIKFLYVGSISQAIRDPRGLIHALADVREENITCEFVGRIDCLHLFEPLQNKLGEKLLFSGQLPHSEVAKKMSEADVLLNIGNKLSTMTPSKLFEYISYGKPIISTYETDDDPCIEYLKSYPLSLLLDCRSNEDFGEKITSFLQRIKTESVDIGTLAELYRLNTPEAFTEIFKT